MRIFSGLLLAVTACSSGGSCPSGPPVLHHPPVDYFAAGVLSRDHELDIVRYDFAKVLWAMGEPSLSQLDGRPQEAYRVLFGRKNERGNFAIRVALESGGARLYWVHLDDAPASEFNRPLGAPNTPEPPLPKECATSKLTAAQVTELRACVERSGFWRIRTEASDVFLNIHPDVWMFEGVKGGEHNAVMLDARMVHPELRGLFECGQLMQRFWSGA